VFLARQTSYKSRGDPNPGQDGQLSQATLGQPLAGCASAHHCSRAFKQGHQRLSESRSTSHTPAAWYCEGGVLPNHWQQPCQAARAPQSHCGHYAQQTHQLRAYQHNRQQIVVAGAEGLTTQRLQCGGQATDDAVATDIVDGLRQQAERSGDFEMLGSYRVTVKCTTSGALCQPLVICACTLLPQSAGAQHAPWWLHEGDQWCQHSWPLCCFSGTLRRRCPYRCYSQ
jgi:hypothetical protein